MLDRTPRGAAPALLAAATAIALVAWGCNRAAGGTGAGGSASSGSAAEADQGGAGAAGPAATIPANADPCAWISPADAARLLGPLSGTGRRGHDAGNTEPASDGRACVYTLARGKDATGAEREVAVEVVADEASTEQASSEAGAALARKLLGGGEGLVADKEKPAQSSGWDYLSWMPQQFLGRIGHLAVRVQTANYDVPTDSFQRLAALVRDRVPDLPVAAEERKWNRSDDPDPCGLLTRAEAEAVLGKLKIPPYRSNGDTPLADPAGQGCSYYAPRHRVFTIKPEWEQGKTLFGVATSATRLFSAVVKPANQAADTLEGTWDQAGSGLDGALYFLKGDRMLTVAYRTAGIDEAAALRLAAPAVKRLAKQ